MALSLAALRGALGFLTRLPAGHDEAAWDAYRQAPVAMVPVGYLVGVLCALPVVVGNLLALPATVVGFGYLLAVYLATGINHLDGVADCGDAAVVHGSPADRREVLKDTTTGVGALAAVGLVLVGLALGGVAVAGLPLAGAVAVVVASEVGAKAGMVLLVGLGEAAHEGFGSALMADAGRGTTASGIALATPVVLLGVPTPDWQPVAVVTLAALGAGILVALVALAWADDRLGGVSGDVFGATNEFARVAGLHVGVIAWTLS
ncbi:adenosylcobinamide-GDP ribazoletransferase [Haloarchaeobius sp. DYHT-AS-18]|uniref:adenosylcobinamide-GDP ribazoletransferase n=1 Tax=Haloarchaeobius sp. DYHT-AS-18 TaxID=3446117 RepID=UPI003EB8E705